MCGNPGTTRILSGVSRDRHPWRRVILFYQELSHYSHIMPQALSCAKLTFHERCRMRALVEIRFLPRVLGLALAGFGHASLVFGSPAPPKVAVESGVLEGTYFGSNNELAFLGVPYAA